MRPQLEADTLYAIVGVVASEPDLDRLLAGVVTLLSDATDCHACFVYLRHGDQMRLRAASSVFSDLVGRVEFGLDEGLVGWTARTRTPAFVREDALNDPRFIYVPEIHEEHFQSMATVPILARSGATIGVVVLHTEAPREFGENVPTFLERAASLLAGAIENARLLEDARQRINALTALAQLGQRIAAVTERERLYRVVTEGVRTLLGCSGSALLITDASDEARVVAEDPPSMPDPKTATTIRAEIVAGSGPMGSLVAFDDREFFADADELLRAVASQVAIALERTELIEHLTSQNLLRQILDALAAEDGELARVRARAAGFDLDRPHVVVEARPPQRDERSWPEVAAALAAAFTELAPGAGVDPGSGMLRALVRAEGDGQELVSALDRIATTHRVAIGTSYVRRGPGGSSALEEARDACAVSRLLAPDGGARSYESLGAYRYLVRLAADERPRDRHTRAVEALAAYDARRRSSLLATLEEYLRQARSPSSTARALFIHPNTLRQRISRIEELTELQLAREDLLSLELAVKATRLAGSS